MASVYLYTLNAYFNSDFLSYLRMGWHHIIDITAYDHLLFVMTLCAIFKAEEWKKILVIVTAFTIGHSITLALTAFNLIPVNRKIIDALIPLTIMFTAVSNIIQNKDTSQSKTFDRKVRISYLIALCFGLIHGMAFASTFRFMMGSTHGIVKQLFAFNCGLELGQVSVVICFMGLLVLFTRLFRLVHREWTLIVSGAGLGIALVLFIQSLLPPAL